MISTVLQGSIVSKNLPLVVDDAVVVVRGTSCGKVSKFMLNDNILSRHMLLIGGTGSGKTNTFFHLVKQLKSQMTDDDVMIIFDTKGDYYDRFYCQQKDYVLSATEENSTKSIWNLFSEILIDGFDENQTEANIAEISWGIFSEAIEKNRSNPFFPNAARDLFASLLICMIRYAKCYEPAISKLNNEFLRKRIDVMTAQQIAEFIGVYDDQKSVINYIGDGVNPQGLGVLAEMYTVLRKILVGNFAANGNFSMRKFVRDKGARTLFIEYDLSRGAILTPIYKLLIDLALKEAMSRKKSGNVFVFCDEFKLLPNLQHIEDAVNFGRGMGIKIFAGLQSIDQLYENYGEANGKNIIAGFSSVLSFKANDEDTRNFVSGLYGKNYVLEQYKLISNNIGFEEKRIGSVVEDWDIGSLKVGEAIVGLPNNVPFKFLFELYR